jgi:hypothetical protein
MASRAQAVTASPSSPPSAGVSTLGDLYDAAESLKDEAVSFFNDYEAGEAGAFYLSGRAATIRDKAASLGEVLNEIGNALASLEV